MYFLALEHYVKTANGGDERGVLNIEHEVSPMQRNPHK
jgi:hypothetical protein